jgi:hypothetical protein
MKVLGHDHVSRNDELILGADFFQDPEKQIAPARGAKKRLPTIAATTTPAREVRIWGPPHML